ncbi:MAG: GNAT family N-acetyltransferase [Eubacteriales bacterium]
MTYRKLTAEDLDPFIRMRIAQLREEGAREELDLVPALKDYYRRHLKDGTFVSWLAVDGEKIVGTSGMSFVEKPPYFSCPNGWIGLLSSMYTDPAYRRRGIARELLGRVVEEARAYGCGSVQITASDMGVLLYSDFGFQKNGNFMQYKL